MASLEVPIWHTKNTQGKNIKGLIFNFFFKEYPLPENTQKNSF